ncbi:PREDICTED: TMV resistance protein N-like [Camelina sativa]|uniref:TMV resistance protein N-like n=1 Tax=Camelina sativa TaxID=90675 RepID=A0ABM0STW2_CAMSA|nr:PREDICTED: TMV resistance protein N-like [Camelina sativa]
MSSATPPKYDVFLSFRGIDTRANFVSFLYKELERRGIRTFKDDKELQDGQRISPELQRAIEESRFAIVVVSAHYAASPWCLDELVKIMDYVNNGSITVMPIFYGVDPFHVRRQIGDAVEQFKKHEAREKDPEKVLSWRKALEGLANISGQCSSKWNNDSKLVDATVDTISEKLMIFTRLSNGGKIVGIERHMKKLNRLVDLNSKKPVRVIGIWASGGNGRSALAKHVYQTWRQHFETHCYLGNVKRVFKDRHLAHLHDEFLENTEGAYLTSKRSFNRQKVLLVADDVDKVEQLDALAEDFTGFGRGSLVVITTQDRQLLISYGIKVVYEVEDLRCEKLCDLLRRTFAFKKRDIVAAIESASRAKDFVTDCFGCLSSRCAGYEKL